MGSGVKLDKQSEHGETQTYKFCAYYSFGNSYYDSCSLSCQLNGMITMWKIQQAKQVDSRARLHKTCT